MAKMRLGSGWYGLDIGTRWRDVSGAITVVILGIQRSGVIVYRREDAAGEDERVTNVVRFVETFAPANDARESAYDARGDSAAGRQA
jgi:hypothetical protein